MKCDGFTAIACNVLINVFDVQVMKLVAPIALVKKLKTECSFVDLPEFVVGDEKRLMQVVLIVVGNAVKFTKDGTIQVRVYLERDRSDSQREPHSLREPRSQADPRSQREFLSQRDFNISPGEQHVHIRVEVQYYTLWCMSICKCAHGRKDGMQTFLAHKYKC